MKKSITLLVLNNFTNDSRVLKEGVSLKKNGYEVKVVALHDSGLKEYEEIENVPVYRISLKSRKWSKNKAIQLLKYFEFIYKVVKVYKNSDILHCNDLNTLPIGIIVKKLFNKNVKIVYDAHEYETELNGLKGIQKKLVKTLEKRLIKYTDKIITVSDAIAKEYVRLYGIEKPALVLNTPPYRSIEKKDIFRETLNIKENQTIFLYQGGLSKGRGIEILLKTFKTINDDSSVIIFMGYGPLKNLIQEASKKYENIYFHKAVSPDVLLEYTSSADFGILFYENNCLNHYYCSPNKMFEYLMAEIPVIVSNLYEMKRLVESNKIGTVANENTPEGLKEAIEKAVELDKEELKSSIQKLKITYNWEEQEKELLKLYGELKMKILTILGARPQFIKAGSVSREIAKHKEIEEIIVHTGQHYDANMSDIFDEMQIQKPNYFLGIGGKSHGAMTGQMIEKIEEVALKEKPNWIMVYGDTNSTLAGAIVASKLHIKLAHIEAGLRSFNMKMPEEVNRILTDRVSNILFCPTDTAVENLKNEGYENLDCKIVKSGDVMQDGAIFYKKLSVKPSIIQNSKLNIQNYILCTIHRAENTDDETRLKSIFEALNEIAQEKQVILPLHPRTRNILNNLKLNIQNLTLIDPVGYLEMVWLIDNCDFVMTDSGGLQKEAYFFEKQCITLRDETEWVELVECGANTLVGADKEKILEVYRNNSEFNKQNSKFNLYGGGKASENIVKELLND